MGNCFLLFMHFCAEVERNMPALEALSKENILVVTWEPNMRLSYYTEAKHPFVPYL